MPVLSKRAHQKQHAGGRDQQADPVGGDVGGHAGGLLALGQALDAKRIDHDVLGRGHRRDQQRAERDEQRRACRIGQREQQDRADQQQLREHQPAAAAAESAREDRHMQRIDQRRPDEFQRVGRADQRKQPDGAEIDAGFAHPDQQRRSRQRQRQPGRKAEHQHDQHARLQINGPRLAPGGRGGFPGEAEAVSGAVMRGC